MLNGELPADQLLLAGYRWLLSVWFWSIITKADWKQTMILLGFPLHNLAKWFSTLHGQGATCPSTWSVHTGTDGTPAANMYTRCL